MTPFASLGAGCRCAALLCVPVLALLVPASAAEAQRLLTLVPGVGQAASAGDLGPSVGPLPTAVQVDLELLRSAPARLEVPTPDGSVLSAERSVFEDRGGGDLMWSGGQPGAGYDTVVLTVEGGRLVGRFGAAGGGVYEIHAEQDGRGGMAPLVGPQPDGPVPFCAVEEGAGNPHDEATHVAAGALAADLPERVGDPQSHERLDILVAYTATAAENWADRGGAHAAIRHAGDYLKMVFRNNRIEVEPHIVHIAQASAGLDRARRDMPWHEQDVLRTFAHDSELRRLRHEHRADIRFVFFGESALLLGFCGRANLLSNISTVEGHSQSAYAWGTNHPLHCVDYAVTFVHEIGHTLGANHDPANVRRPHRVFRPYAYGHADLDVMPSLGTAMSYRGQIEPFFSTPRIQPWGAVLGIADERDNERLLQETVHVGVRYSDHLRSLKGVPAPPGDLRAWFEGGAAHLAWRDNAPDADGYEVEYFSASGSGGIIRQKVQGRTGAILTLPDKKPGTGYKFEVRAVRGDERSLRSDIAVVVVPGEPIAAPSGVSAMLTAQLESVEIRWTDNSDNESWFDVQLLQDGDPILRNRVAADSERSSFHRVSVGPRAGAEYGVRVFAFNASGYSESSEVATFRWAHPLAPRTVTGVSARAIGPTTVRLSWTVDPTVLYLIQASLRDWVGKVGDRSHDVAGGTAWKDFEGLARGGRYAFSVLGFGTGRSVPSFAYLTLGERGAGPRSPSDVTSALERSAREGDRVRLGWKDNSNDELGFEVQYALVSPNFTGRFRWQRLRTVPADTESVVHDLPHYPHERIFRVFAYNERGYSRVGNSRASAPRGSCRADAETLCLQDSRFEVKVNWWEADGESGVGQVVEERTDDSGLFRFFDPENWEILIKVLDGCGINGRMWVLGASTTDLGYRIRVTDTVTGESRSYENEPGRPAPAIVDTQAFSVVCVDGAAP